jgi:hypothetical protein
MSLPRHLRTALDAIANNEGDDLEFVLGYLNPSTARSYVSKLKRRGFAYVYNGEVWLTESGRNVSKKK